MTKKRYTEQADAELEQAHTDPLSLDEYVNKLFGQPQYASHAAKYLLEAIQSQGTRTVIEEGEELTRWCFFDDPTNNGEHAILGNTKMLNRFVDTLQSIVSGTGKTEKLLWVYGPTATGKSELKRCLINGLREYSKTEDGRRWTVEWNETVSSYDSTFGNEVGQKDDQQAWKTSPVQVSPLSVYPEKVRKQIIEDLNEEFPNKRPTRGKQQLDPFSQEYFDYLIKQYKDDRTDELFSQVTSKDHLQVVNYVVDVGHGIGVLHAEDQGQQPKTRLVGRWLPQRNNSMSASGRRDPRTFTFEGVLSQGNGGLTVIEEASKHADLLGAFLNILDENEVKLDQQTRLGIDTVVLTISNPDLEQTLNQQSELNSKDPLKALKRRMEEHRVRYLTNHSLESQLLRKEIVEGDDEFELGDDDGFDSTAPLHIKLFNGDDCTVKEIAPHGIDAAAMANIVSRLVQTEEMPNEFTLVDKAIVFDNSYVRKGDTRYDKDDLNLPDDEEGNGEEGIPVTYTRDIISELITANKSERSNPELAVENVVLPQDIIEEMVKNANSTNVFSDAEVTQIEQRLGDVRSYVFKKQKEDVLNAAMTELETSREEIQEYIEHVHAWETGTEIKNTATGKMEEPDALLMKVFEINTLGISTEKEYGNKTHEPNHQSVTDFRKNKIINPLSRLTWEQRSENFDVTDIPLEEIPVLRDLLSTNTISDLKQVYEDFQPDQWDNPKKNTTTKKVKEDTIENMIELFDYTEESAELTSSLVMNKVSKQWD